MQISAWTIYLVGLCDQVSVGCTLTAVALVGWCIIEVLSEFMEFKPPPPEVRAAANKSRMRRMWFAAGLVAVCALVPSSSTAAAMIVVPAVVNNERVQGIAGASLEALLGLTEKWTKELGPKAEKSSQQVEH